MLVVGYSSTGRAVAAGAGARGTAVAVTDDEPGARAAAEGDGHRVLTPAEALDALDGFGCVVPSPGVPEGHPILAAAARLAIPVTSELGLAARWTDLPLVVVTGTNGKSTVTTLTAAALTGSGLVAAACGNLGQPLAAAVDEPADVYVVEASSFQLRFTADLGARVGVWLNFGADHLDWHGDLDRYREAKRRVWAGTGAPPIAVANLDDPVVRSEAEALEGPVRWFGRENGDCTWGGGTIRLDGTVVVGSGELRRALPHELANGAATALAATAAGASVTGIAEALVGFEGLPHRTVLVGEAGGVRYVDDSKATDPHATAAALAGFDSVVLIAGGRNKGLDLGELVPAAGSVRAVVAIGDAAGEVVAAFDGHRPVVVAGDMEAAVAAATDLARPGDVVLLSPACASFDWYSGYAERGEDFARAVGVAIGGAR